MGGEFRRVNVKRYASGHVGARTGKRGSRLVSVLITHAVATGRGNYAVISIQPDKTLTQREIARSLTTDARHMGKRIRIVVLEIHRVAWERIVQLGVQWSTLLLEQVIQQSVRCVFEEGCGKYAGFVHLGNNGNRM